MRRVSTLRPLGVESAYRQRHSCPCRFSPPAYNHGVPHCVRYSVIYSLGGAALSARELELTHLNTPWMDRPSSIAATADGSGACSYAAREFVPVGIMQFALTQRQPHLVITIQMEHIAYGKWNF